MGPIDAGQRLYPFHLFTRRLIILEQAFFDADPHGRHSLVEAAVGDQYRTRGVYLGAERNRGGKQTAGQQQSRYRHWADSVEVILGCSYHTQLLLHSQIGCSITSIESF
jgi:hypothetical protein